MKLNTEFHTENVQFVMEDGSSYIIKKEHLTEMYKIMDQHIDREEE